MTKPLSTTQKKPAWLKRKLPTSPEYQKVMRLLSSTQLHTVCQEAQCPNQWECFSKRTATFLILGSHCTRNCRFCSVQKGTPTVPDPAEPRQVTATALTLGLRYVVLTSVTRDDLPDGGAAHFAETILMLNKAGLDVEVLIPDFSGSITSLQTIINARPRVINHNIETVPRLYPEVRPQASYKQSLDVLQSIKRLSPDIPVKSGIMLGLGENNNEIRQVLYDLLSTGCNILTMGQYLQPTANHLPVRAFVSPEKFESWRQETLAMGFQAVACGPHVRSSYKAAEML